MKSAARGSCVTARSGCKMGWEVEGLSACSSGGRPEYALCCGLLRALCMLGQALHLCTTCVQGKQRVDSRVYHLNAQEGTAQLAVTFGGQVCAAAEGMQGTATVHLGWISCWWPSGPETLPLLLIKPSQNMSALALAAVHRLGLGNAGTTCAPHVQPAVLATQACVLHALEQLKNNPGDWVVLIVLGVGLAQDKYMQ